MRSLQLKFSALVVTLLLVASIGLAWMATRHERSALEAGVREHGSALATNLAGDAKIPLLAEDELAMGALVQQSGEEEGLVAARLIKHERCDSRRIVASLDPDESDKITKLLARRIVEEPDPTVIERPGGQYVVAMPIVYTKQWLGEVQIEFDRVVAVEPRGATPDEGDALETEEREHASDLARKLAGDAKIPLLDENQLAMRALVEQYREEEELVAARLIERKEFDSGEITEKIVAALNSDEQGEEECFSLATAEEPSQTRIERLGNHLVVATPVIFSGEWLGEAQIELDLDILVEPVVKESQRQLALLALVVVLLGILTGIGFVALLIAPIRRLQAGVERLADGDLATRIPPSSRDEVGELTRAFNEMAEALQREARIQKVLGRYASDHVLKTLRKSPAGSELAGAEREVTIVFADIRSFTRLSEGMKAQDVVSLLKEIFQLISDRLLACDGTIDKFIGDSVMALFGAPVADSDHAVHAVSAAIDIQQAVAARNQQLGGDGQRVEVGIGIHTGVVIVGNIGSDRRTDFTAVGDAVNVAHRLEKLARPGDILVSEAVQRQVRGTVKLSFEGERQLSGRKEPVHVYSVDPSPPSASAAGRGDHAEPT